MLSKFTFAIVALQASLALAGKVVMSNRCDYDIWVWSVSTGYPSTSVKVPARGTHSEDFIGSSTSLKVSKSDALVADQHTQFEYTIDNNQVWYDISLVNCATGDSASNCPGHDEGLAMHADNDSCGKIDCPAGEYCPTQAYYVDKPLQKPSRAEPVFMCPPSLGTNVELYMKVCSGQPQIKRSIAGRVEIDGET